MGGLVTSIIIAGFGGMAVVVGLLVFVQRVRFYTRGVKGTGTVVWESERSTGPGRHKHATMRAPVIEVTDATTGQTFQFRSSFSSTASHSTIGAKMPVRYMPGDPDQAEVDALLPMWFFPVGALTIGAILLTAWWHLPA